MPINDSPFTDPDTLLGLYTQPDDEVLQAEIAMLTGQTARDAVNAAIAQTSSSSSGTAGTAGAAGTAGGVRGTLTVRPRPDDFDL